MSVKVKVIFYSLYGHIYRMAEAVAAGAREVPGAEVELLQVAETLPNEVLTKMGAVDAKNAFAHVPLADPRGSALHRKFRQEEAVPIEDRARLRAPQKSQVSAGEGIGRATPGDDGALLQRAVHVRGNLHVRSDLLQSRRGYQ